MKRKISIIVSALFMLTITAVFMSPPILQASDSFWSGEKVSETTDTVPFPPFSLDFISPENRVIIHQAIVDSLPEELSSLGAVWRMTGGEPIELTASPRGVRIYDSSKAQNGYTLLNSFVPAKPDSDPNDGIDDSAWYTVLIDMDGTPVHGWDLPNKVPLRGGFEVGIMLPGGDLTGGVAGIGIPPSYGQVDWCGNTVHTWPEFNVHHAHQREGLPVGYHSPNADPKVTGGKSLVMGWWHPEKLELIPEGEKLEDDIIREYAWDGTVEFEWKASDYWDQMGLDEATLAAIRLFGDCRGGGLCVPSIAAQLFGAPPTSTGHTATPSPGLGTINGSLLTNAKNAH